MQEGSVMLWAYDVVKLFVIWFVLWLLWFTVTHYWRALSIKVDRLSERYHRWLARKGT